MLGRLRTRKLFDEFYLSVESAHLNKFPPDDDGLTSRRNALRGVLGSYAQGVTSKRIERRN